VNGVTIGRWATLATGPPTSFPAVRPESPDYPFPMAVLTLAILVVVRVGVSLQLQRLNERLGRWEESHAGEQGSE